MADLPLARLSLSSNREGRRATDRFGVPVSDTGAETLVGAGAR